MEYNRNSYTAQHLAVRVEHCTHNVPWIGMMIQHQPLYCSSHAMHRCKLSVIANFQSLTGASTRHESLSCRGMNTSVSYCRPNEHAEKQGRAYIVSKVFK